MKPPPHDYAPHPSSPPKSRIARLRPVILPIFALVFLGYCIGDTVSFLRAMEKRKPTLKRWLPYAAEIGADDQLYDRHPDYLYPPVFLVLMKPLTWMPLMAAAITWQLAKYVCILIAFGASWRMFKSSAGPPPDWVKLASIIIAARFVHSDLRHGNINLFIAALVTGAGVCLVTNRRFLCGLLVAIAACIKVTPGLWGVYLLYRRDWKALAGCAIGAVLAFEAIPSIALGVELNHTLLGQWRVHVLDSFVSGGEIDSVGMNQSLTAVTNRLLGHPSVKPVDRIGPAELDEDAINYIQRLLSVFLLILTAVAIGRKSGNHPLIISIDWAILAPVTLALSGYTWTGHFCLLIPGFVAFFTFVAERTPRKPLDRLVVGLGFTAALLFVLTSDLLTERGREFTSRIGAPLIGALQLFVVLALIRQRWCAEPPGGTAAQQADSMSV